MLGQSLGQMGARGAGGLGEGLPSRTTCPSSAFSSGLFWAVPLLDRLGVLSIPSPPIKLCVFPEAPWVDAKPYRPHILGRGPATHYP